MPLPLISLAYLAIRQVSKPLAEAIKYRAKTNETLRNYILVPPAQIYHRLDTRMKLLQHGFGVRPTAVKPLSEAAAIEVAADILGEVIIFSVASGCLVFEYLRQQRNERTKQNLQNDRLAELERRATELLAMVADRRAVISEIVESPGVRVEDGRQKVHVAVDSSGKPIEKGISITFEGKEMA